MMCLALQIEKLARLQYLRNKDPKECALLYLALNRRQVLAGLFKISKDEKDKVLFAFLSRNFEVLQNTGVYSMQFCYLYIVNHTNWHGLIADLYQHHLLSLSWLIIFFRYT